MGKFAHANAKNPIDDMRNSNRGRAQISKIQAVISPGCSGDGLSKAMMMDRYRKSTRNQRLSIKKNKCLNFLLIGRNPVIFLYRCICGIKYLEIFNPHPPTLN